MWSAEDQSLLDELDDEALIGQVWRRLGGVDPSLHSRAAGLVGLLRQVDGGAASIEAALRGDLDGLVARLRPARLRPLSPALLHHLAVFEERVASSVSATSVAGAAFAYERSLAAWLALVDEKTHLLAIARSVVGSAMDEPSLHSFVASFALNRLDQWSARARAEVLQRSAHARAILDALANVRRSCALAELSEGATRVVVDCAERLKAGILDAAVTEIANRAGLRNGGAEVLMTPRWMAEVAALWRFAGEDEQIERIAIEWATPAAWSLYRESEWAKLRALFAPVEPLIDRLARRIVGDPSRLAYAAACAQMLVFRSEAAMDSAAKLALAERSVQVCPTHRNGRLVLANALSDLALDRLDTLDQRGWLSVRSSRSPRLDDVSRLVQRALELAPSSGRATEAKRRLDAIREGA